MTEGEGHEHHFIMFIISQLVSRSDTRTRCVLREIATVEVFVLGAFLLPNRDDMNLNT